MPAISKVAPVYRYSFERPLENVVLGDIGVFHSSEIPFVFGNDAFPLGKLGAGAPLSVSMQSYWTAFARTGVPDHVEIAWPMYDASETLLVLDEPIATRAQYKAAQCDFWDSLL